MTLTVLNVAFPLAPVSEDAVGGAEQVLALIDRALVRAGHRSIVVAAEGSRCAGELVATPRVTGWLDGAARRGAQLRHRAAIERVLQRWPVDVVHVHGLDFEAYVPGPGPAMLATLHLPPSWYAPTVFALERPRSWFNCVSASQRACCPTTAEVIVTIDNGVDLDALRPGEGRGGFVFALGRVCPEKGFHRALDAARRAGAPMLLAGEVFGYVEHRRYFDTCIRPRLDGIRRFIGPVGRARKRALMAAARGVLVPSEVAETSSLVAMEALACGTPVITSGAGALADIVEHGRTGFVVADEAEMAAAIGRLGDIDRAACRRTAEQRFGARRMTDAYLELYATLCA